ncbi:PREDICTED: uncharacterized protein LOC105954039 [Erythranthe guttata]|uniref:uncharacterized protein LOC105954039 n=1 Tax=Erythranthe guttata TaxID=4155 RepID=UPI00064D8598|nr:PREDICTED: uncharacterized protein LOC105954039 [Erythranthe guttata]|eukprot:XP_012833163.1 PREDICTED: uncharacterized protein LOC105954039 [Erythranthe guttata]
MSDAARGRGKAATSVVYPVFPGTPGWGAINNCPHLTGKGKWSEKLPPPPVGTVGRGSSPEPPGPGTTPAEASTLRGAEASTVTLTVEHLQVLIAAASKGGPLPSPTTSAPYKRGPPGQLEPHHVDPEGDTPVPEEDYETEGTPFTKKIQGGGLPATFRPITYEYTGVTDPWEHISRFNTTASLHRLADGVRCLVFATTLAGPAQRWFSQLPKDSVDSFAQLREIFLNHFASSKKQKRSTLTLFAVRQRENEPLRSYVRRFNTATLEIPATSEEVLINALAQGLRMGEFFDSISKKAPTSFNDLLRRAEKYINAEEARQSRASEMTGVPERRKEKGKEDGRKPAEVFSRREGVAERRTGPRFENYAPLNAPPSEILVAIANHPRLKWPRTYSEVPKKPIGSGAYCRFHNDHGHSTDDCQHLRDEIERLIRNKNLSEFVREGREATPKGSRKPGLPPPGTEKPGKSEAPQPPNNYIHTIFGGPAGGDSNRARRAHLRELQELRGELAMMYRVSLAPPITFGVEDETGIHQPHNDALVITAMVANYDVARILVDTGSSADIIYYDCFRQMRLNLEVRRVDTALVGFAGEVVQPMGEVTLPISLGTEPLRATRSVRFLIIDAPSTYNMIMGRPSMNVFEAIVSTFHMKMKFPVMDKVGEVRGDQELARKCYNLALRESRRINPVSWGKAERPREDDIGRSEEKRPRIDPEEKEQTHIQPMEELAVVHLSEEDPSRITKMGTRMDSDTAEKLRLFLQENQDVFAWTPCDLRGIDPMVTEHCLNVRPDARPVKQKRRHFGAEKDKVIEAEVKKLLEAGHIREVRFPSWLSNAVLVRKADGSWRMCVDFRDLNQACPKDHYPLPRIDQLVDSTAGCAMLSMMDASQGYHQIRLKEEDQEKVSFVTSTGTYCYVVMPFGLKNAGATYQRLVDKMFREQLGKNMEVYVDDMLVKSKEVDAHISDLRETFGTLRKYGMKLNPSKCAFGVQTGKFLGYMVTPRGVEANPEKVRAVMDMRPPRNIKEVQTLAGRITALSRFISRVADASHPFIRILRKSHRFEWDEAADKAFEQLKVALTQLPLLVKPETGEKLYVYMAAGEQAISTVLLSERNGAQYPIYYVSRMLKGAEKRYSEIEKMGLALVTAARKLRPYFLSHSIVVRTNFPLKATLGKIDVSGRMVKWAVELGQFDIEYEPRISIKAQALADFLQETTRSEEEQVWKIYIDGSSSPAGSGAGVVIISPEKEEYEYAIKLTFKASNNEAEYEALIHALQIAAEVGADMVEIYSDSQLVVQQVSGTFETRDERMEGYRARAKALMSNFRRAILEQIPREENERADFLARIGSLSAECSSRNITILTGLPKKPQELFSTSATVDWRAKIVQCLQGGVIPDRREQAKMEAKARYFCLDGGVLYKRGFTRPHLRCLGEAEASHAIREVHEGCCGDHAGGRAIALRLLRAGYFWPTMRKDAFRMVRSCEKCQKYGPRIHVPGADMTIIDAPCPFAQWGIDLVGPLPMASGQRKFLIVAIDYFSKWVEAEALARITDTEVMKFIWKNICCRYGIPRNLVSDNGTQFNSAKISKWCEGMGIKQRFAAVAHPQANGQVEVTNRTLMEGIKKRLEKAKGSWVEELHSVLWSYRTSPKEATGETPFALVHGTEAVITLEVGMPSSRILSFHERRNNDEIRGDLDLIIEKREQAAIKMEASKARMKNAYDRKVKTRQFQVGDMVLKQADALKAVGKMGPNWEGPYIVKKALKGGAYELADAEGKKLPRPWNIRHLKKFFT